MILKCVGMFSKLLTRTNINSIGQRISRIHLRLLILDIKIFQILHCFVNSFRNNTKCIELYNIFCSHHNRLQTFLIMIVEISNEGWNLDDHLAKLLLLIIDQHTKGVIICHYRSRQSSKFVLKRILVKPIYYPLFTVTKHS